MNCEIEFKMIGIKDISKIEQRDKVKDSTFGEECVVDYVQDIADQYCKDVMNKAQESLDMREIKYIGCTERIGNYEFAISNDAIDYSVIFQKDTYEGKLQFTVLIGYAQKRVGLPPVNQKEMITEYDLFLEKLKLCIKDVLIRDWKKCIWISDNQSLELSKEIYSEIYVTENDLRAFISKIMIENFGAEWYDRAEFYKLKGSIKENSGKVKRNVPSFANIDINIYTTTLETLLSVMNANIYSDKMPDSVEVQKLIKERIFATTQLDKMQGALDSLRNVYEKKYNIWEKYFQPFILENERWDILKTNFVDNRNHVAHNKLLDLAAKEKMLQDTREFRKLIRQAVGKFDAENLSEEVEETLQAIEDQREYEREAMTEIIESESGVVIRNSKEILQMFQDTIDEIYTEILSMIYFDENSEAKVKNNLEIISGNQLLLTIKCYMEELEVYGQVDIDESEGMTSILQINLFVGDENIAHENIIYINGEAEYHVEQTCYMPVIEDEYRSDRAEAIKSTIEKFILEKRNID